MLSTDDHHASLYTQYTMIHLLVMSFVAIVFVIVNVANRSGRKRTTAELFEQHGVKRARTGTNPIDGSDPPIVYGCKYCDWSLLRMNVTQFADHLCLNCKQIPEPARVEAGKLREAKAKKSLCPDLELVRITQ